MGSIVRDFCRTAKQVRLQLETGLAAVGGSYATFVVLDAISYESGLSQRDIAHRISIEGPALTRHLDHLEADGLVERRRDPADRRIVRVYPTEAGTQLYDSLCPVVARLEHRLIATLKPQELAILRQALAAIQKTIQAIAEDERGAEVGS
ncbi:MAG TPA: MarR family transcriptional regulator [Ktedonobacterales bacterium]|nr:MarR family transcriptional regulator [Ktedonobacterales bacterium]